MEAASSTAKPTVTVVHPAGKHSALVLGIATDGDRVVAVGGQGKDLLLVSSNGGKSFKSRNSGGGGLRGTHVRGDTIWVCGEYGHVAFSHDFGESWSKVPLKTSACLFGVIEDGGKNLWTAGDSGYVARTKAGVVKFTKVKGITDYIGRISDSVLGVLVPTDSPGHLYVCEGKRWRQTGAESGADLMAARVTPAGTVIAVGGGGAVLRSTNRGETFERVAVGTKGMVAGVEVFADGRVVVAADGGKLFVSTDDGAKLTKLAHEHTKGQLWCAARHGDSVLVGGEDGLVLRLA